MAIVNSKYEKVMEKYSSEDQYNDLWILLTHMRYAIYRAREKELKPYGISPEQVGVLVAVLALGNRAKFGDISRLMFRKPHTTSMIVDRMVKKGLVRKVSDLDGKNLVRITLTDKGRQIYRQAIKRESIHRIMSSLPEKDRQQLWSYLVILQDKAWEGIETDHRPPLPGKQ